MSFRFCDETDYGFGWIADDRAARTSHALVVDGDVWLVDALHWEDALERARSLGRVAGVIQLLDRHNRDCAAVAARLDVPYLRLPEHVDGGLEVVPIVDLPRWHERALWWPERRVLVVAEAVGTVGWFTFGRRSLGLNPLFRLRPPSALRRFDPDVMLVSHGEGVLDASEPYRDALRIRSRGTGG